MDWNLAKAAFARDLGPPQGRPETAEAGMTGMDAWKLVAT